MSGARTGRVWGAAMPGVEEARWLQQRLNTIESQIIDAREVGLRPSRRIYGSPWLAVLLIFAMLLMMDWCSAGSRAHADDTTDGGLAGVIAAYDLRLATHRVERYRAALGFASPISISVDRDSEMPKLKDGRTVDAHTTRAWQDEGCTVHVTRLSVQRASILAHEVCHCVADYSVLGPWGYVGVDAEERRVREQAASRCEDVLMKRSAW